MKRLRDWWVDHPAFDLAVAALLLALVWRQDWSFGAAGRSVLQAFGGLATALAGFSTLTVSLLASLNHPDRLRSALSQVGHRMARLIIVSILSLWTASVVFASAIALGRDSPAAAALFAMAAAIAAGAVGRSVYLLLLMLRALLPAPAAPPPLVDAEIVLSGDDPAGYEVSRVVPSRGARESGD